MVVFKDTWYARFYVKTLEKLKTLDITLDDSGDPDDIIEAAREIEGMCNKEYRELGYYSPEECYKWEIAREVDISMEEKGAAIVWDFSKNDIVFVPTINRYVLIAVGEPVEEVKALPLDEQEAYADPHVLGGLLFDFEDLARAYAIYHNVRVAYLGVYHSHPYTIPLPSSVDARTASEERSILDGIDNEATGWVFAVGGWSGFWRNEHLYEYDAWICYRPDPESLSRIECFGVFSREKMHKLTHDNLLYNSEELPDKIYIWKDRDNVFRIYQAGECQTFRGGEIDKEIERVKKAISSSALAY